MDADFNDLKKLWLNKFGKIEIDLEALNTKTGEMNTKVDKVDSRLDKKIKEINVEIDKNADELKSIFHKKIL